jgi:hypothetical protein
MMDERNNDSSTALLHHVAGLNRRSLLGSAAGSFALAASGLLLPDWLIEDAAADNHPVRGIQGRKDQRRNKRRHEHDRRHRQHHKHKGASKQHPRGSKGIYGIEFRLEIEGYRPIKVSFYGTGAEFDWRLVKSKTLGPAENDTFGGSLDPCALWIDGRFWVEATNPLLDYPKLKLGYGGSVSASGWTGGRTLFDDQMKEGDSLHPSLIDGFGIEVERLTDSPRKVFKVVAEAPPP